MHRLLPLAPIVAALLAALLAPAERAAAQVRCDAETRVDGVLLSLTGGGERLAARIPVAVGAGVVEPRLADRGSDGQYTLLLGESVRARELVLAPRLEGHVASVTVPPYVQVVNGRCVARVSYRLDRLWAFEVDSRPDRRRVAVIRAGGRDTTFLQTRRATPPFTWRDSVRLRVYEPSGISYPVTLSAADFDTLATRAEVRLDRTDIYRTWCRSETRGQRCTPNLLLLMDRRFGTEEITVRLRTP